MSCDWPFLRDMAEVGWLKRIGYILVCTTATPVSSYKPKKMHSPSASSTLQTLSVHSCHIKTTSLSEPSFFNVVLLIPDMVQDAPGLMDVFSLFRQTVYQLLMLTISVYPASVARLQGEGSLCGSPSRVFFFPVKGFFSPRLWLRSGLTPQLRDFGFEINLIWFDLNMACCDCLWSHICLQILAFAASVSGEFTVAMKHSCCSSVLEKPVFLLSAGFLSLLHNS